MFFFGARLDSFAFAFAFAVAVAGFFSSHNHPFFALILCFASWYSMNTIHGYGRAFYLMLMLDGIVDAPHQPRMSRAHCACVCVAVYVYIYLCVRSCAVRAMLFSSALAYFSLTWALAQSAFMLLYFSFRFKLVFSFSNHHPIPFSPRTPHQSHRQHLGTPAGLACV